MPIPLSFHVILGLSVAAALGHPAGAQTTAPVDAAPARSITADLNAVAGPHCTTFRACVGAGRVGEGLRADWQQQLKLCRDELGFESLRCHDLFHDELGVYREDKAGKPIYNFQYIDLVYDYLLSIGVRPFVEIGFMPDALATIHNAASVGGMTDDPAHPGHKRRVTVFYRKSNVTPPRDVAKWQDLVTAVVRHWTDRYGADEVKQWRFEIWNEPNHVAFFSPNEEKDRAQEYFRLYTETAAAITGVNPAYRVGGPATAGPAYIPQLIAYADQHHVPLDFISFHSYGLQGGPGGFDEFGAGLQYLSAVPNGVARTANSVHKSIDASAKPGLPICITEWSTSYSDRDPVHDDYISAPYILEQIKNSESIAVMSYWTFTDLFEENGTPPRPFYGGFGLLNLQGIKKPAYFAYRFMNLLGSQELTNTDPHSWVCRDAAGGATALFWDLTLFPGPKVPDQVRFRAVRPTALKQTVTLTLKSLHPGRYHLAVYGTGFERNDAYTAYLKMGAPTNLMPAQVNALKAVATGAPQEESDVTVSATGTWTGTFPLRTNDVDFVRLTPQ